MKALRLRTRWDYRVRGTTLGGVSRERRRSRWNISRSTHTSTTRWLQWSGPTAIWCERNGLSMTAARCANSWNVASVDRPSRSRRSATGIGLSTRSRPRAAFPSSCTPVRQRFDLLPPHTAYASQQLLEQVEELDRRVREFEQRIQAVFKPTPAIQLLLTLPGVGLTLAAVIALEVGDVARFARAEKLAAYAGATPRVHTSGGKTRFGPSRPDVNRYLKWAFVEAANAICIGRGRAPHCHVSRLYERIARRKGHAKAIGAVARHLAEATFWILRKHEPYREPKASA